MVNKRKHSAHRQTKLPQDRPTALCSSVSFMKVPGCNPSCSGQKSVTDQCLEEHNRIVGHWLIMDCCCLEVWQILYFLMCWGLKTTKLAEVAHDPVMTKLKCQNKEPQHPGFHELSASSASFSLLVMLYSLNEISETVLFVWFWCKFRSQQIDSATHFLFHMFDLVPQSCDRNRHQGR